MRYSVHNCKLDTAKMLIRRSAYAYKAKILIPKSIKIMYCICIKVNAVMYLWMIT